MKRANGFYACIPKSLEIYLKASGIGSTVEVYNDECTSPGQAEKKKSTTIVVLSWCIPPTAVYCQLGDESYYFEKRID